MVTIGYRVLFTINVLHEYYADWQSKDTVIIPTEATRQILKNYKLLFKPTATGGIILARITDEQGTLKIPISDTEKFKLTFYLNPSSPYFYNRTNLPAKPIKVDQIIPNRIGYYFKNSKNNRFTPTGVPGGVTHLMHLSEKADSEVSGEDEIIFIPSIFRVRFDAAVTSFTIKIMDETEAILHQKTITETVAFDEYEVRLAENLPAGFYKISIDGGSSRRVYISDKAFHDAPFGLIEIFHPSNPVYSFLKKTGSLIQVKGGIDYYVWFKNRKLKWRYVYQGVTPGSIQLVIPSVNFTQTGKIFESDEEINITDSYAEVKTNSDKKLPNPDGRTIKAAVGSTDYFAEIHL